MNLLVLENSTSVGSLAWVENGRVVREETHESPRGRGAQWFENLANFAGRPIDGILIGTGPGSYNGLRSAAAAAWGLARARNVPLRGVSSLLGYPDENYAVVGDARAGQWFFAAVRDRHFQTSPLLIPAGRGLPDGAGVLYCVNKESAPSGALLRHPSAGLLARFWEVAGTPEPIYLKPPHITMPARPPARLASPAPADGPGGRPEEAGS
ncbi:MAG: hypothetical protein SFU53_10325 [Terrimicrobiaceae bacterium]|nr:hypothetical protein [Terrimicrobiaceae bacterium]